MTLQTHAQTNFQWCQWGADPRVKRAQTLERGPRHEKSSKPSAAMFLVNLKFLQIDITAIMSEMLLKTLVKGFKCAFE